MIPFSPFSAVGAKVFGALSLALSLALALTLLWGRAGWREAESWKLAHKAQIGATIAAEQEAKAKAIAARISTENTSAVLARKADHAETELAALRAAADRFGSDRLLRAQGAGCAPGGAAAAAAPGAAPGSNRPGGAAVDERIVLTRPEYDQFVANSLRLEAVNRWGQTLITARLAIPEAEFGALPPETSNTEGSRP